MDSPNSMTANAFAVAVGEVTALDQKLSKAISELRLKANELEIFLSDIRTSNTEIHKWYEFFNELQHQEEQGYWHIIRVREAAEEKMRNNMKKFLRV